MDNFVIGTIQENIKILQSDLNRISFDISNNPGIPNDFTSLNEGDLIKYDGTNFVNFSPTYLTQETDPFFTQSTVSNITNGTGFLKNNGSGTWSYDTNTYLTQETDPFFTQSPAAGIGTGTGFLKNNGGSWSYDQSTYLTSVGIDEIGGLNYELVNDYELIRKSDVAEAEGAGVTLDDTMETIYPSGLNTGPTYIYKKTMSYFTRVGDQGGQIFGVNQYTTNIYGYNQLLHPSHLHASAGGGGGFYIHSPFANNIRVGVNIELPEEALEVDGSIQIDSANQARLKFQYKQSGQNPYALAEIDAEADGAGGQLEFYTSGAGTGVSKRLTINNQGALGLGTTPAYGDAGQILQSGGQNAAPSWINSQSVATTATPTFAGVKTSTIIAEDGYFDNGNVPLKISQNSTPSNAADRNVAIFKNAISGQVVFSDGLFLYGSFGFSGPPVLNFRDGRAGNVYFTGYAAPTSYNSGRYYPHVHNGPSDDRLKHNEIIIQNGLDTIRQLIPQKYQKTNEMKDANYTGELEDGTWKWEAGVIAQDVEKIKGLEYLVGPGGFPSKEDVENGAVYKEYPKTVVYNDLFVYNIAATKELDTIVQKQAQLISSLEARIKTLESK